MAKKPKGEEASTKASLPDPDPRHNEAVAVELIKMAMQNERPALLEFDADGRRIIRDNLTIQELVRLAYPSESDAFIARFKEADREAVLEAWRRGRHAGKEEHRAYHDGIQRGAQLGDDKAREELGPNAELGKKRHAELADFGSREKPKKYNEIERSKWDEILEDAYSSGKNPSGRALAERIREKRSLPESAKSSIRKYVGEWKKKKLDNDPR